MKKNVIEYLKTIILIIALVPWSIIAIILWQINLNLSNGINVNSERDYRDTIVVNYPNFLSQSPKEGINEALDFYNIHHKNIVLAQTILETGNYKSHICLKYNNLFGLYNSKKKQYYKYNHWSESVLAYKRLIQKKYRPNEDYYAFLQRIHYAENPNYIKILKELQ